MELKGYVYSLARKRRSIRKYRSDPIDLGDVLYAISTAIQAPSGANRQPWRFILVDDPDLKRRIRRICEIGEEKFYKSNNVPEWFRKWASERGISLDKPFLTDAPYLIIVLSNRKTPYSKESTWLAIGYLLLALEEKGLSSLTYTPSESKEVLRVLGVPDDYKLEVIIPVGKPAEDKVKEKRLLLKDVVFLNRWNNPINIP